jgi:hypothetical protein
VVAAEVAEVVVLVEEEVEAGVVEVEAEAE